MLYSEWKRIVVSFLFLLSPPIYAATFTVAPGDDVVGEIQTIVAGPRDNFISLAKRYGLSIHEIKEANPDIKKIHSKQTIILPTQFILPPAKYRAGIVINTPELRLYFFEADGKTVDTYPVAMGREGWRTPLMQTSIVKKAVRPTWNVPKSIWQHTYETKGIKLPAAIPPGPNNPLGPYAMYMAKRGYLIHGNNNSKAIGTYATSGCIRMYNEDVTELFPRVPIETVVYITNQQYRAGWQGDKLFFKAQPAVELDEPATELNLTTPEEVIAEATMKRPAQIDWNKVNLIAEEETGVPQTIN